MLTHERLLEVLDYDPETGEFRWKPHKGLRKVRAGTVAGTLNQLGYRQISIKRKVYLAHRLAWFYVHGTWPTRCIDHINRNRADNRLANLRDVTHSQNGANSRPKNASHPKGVTFHAASGFWYANVTKDRKGTFLGNYRTMEEAHKAYVSGATRIHGEFFNTGEDGGDECL